MQAVIAAIGSARDAACRQCRALLEDVEPAARKVVRENEVVQRAFAERRYDDIRSAAGAIVDAGIAYEDAFKDALDSPTRRAVT